MINIVYFDMDGVLADFEKTLSRMVGKPFDEILHESGDDPIGDYLLQLTHSKKFFEKMDAMPEFPIFHRLIFELLSQKNLEVMILTATGSPNPETVRDQKKAWLRNNGLERIPVIDVLKSRYKCEYASPDSLLIDDREKAVMPFVENGGKAILHHNIRETIISCCEDYKIINENKIEEYMELINDTNI